MLPHCLLAPNAYWEPPEKTGGRDKVAAEGIRPVVAVPFDSHKEAEEAQHLLVNGEWLTRLSSFDLQRISGTELRQALLGPGHQLTTAFTSQYVSQVCVLFCHPIVGHGHYEWLIELASCGAPDASVVEKVSRSRHPQPGLITANIQLAVYKVAARRPPPLRWIRAVTKPHEHGPGLALRGGRCVLLK